MCARMEYERVSIVALFDRTDTCLRMAHSRVATIKDATARGKTCTTQQARRSSDVVMAIRWSHRLCSLHSYTRPQTPPLGDCTRTWESSEERLHSSIGHTGWT